MRVFLVLTYLFIRCNIKETKKGGQMPTKIQSKNKPLPKNKTRRRVRLFFREKLSPSVFAREPVEWTGKKIYDK